MTASSSTPLSQVQAALARMGAPQHLAEPLLSALGQNAAEEVSGDPWLLLVVPGVTVEQADYCARRILGDTGDRALRGDPRRGRAVVGHLLRRCALRGHTAMEAGQLRRALRDTGVLEAETAVQAALESGTILAFEALPDDADDFEEEPAEPPEAELRYTLADIGMAEERLGAGLNRLAAGEPIMDSATARETVEAEAARSGQEAGPEAVAALVTAALRGVCVLTHGPGSEGAVAEAVALAEAIARESGLRLLAAAPTAQSADALRRRCHSDLTDRVAALGRLLETDEDGSFGRTAERPLEAGMVVLTGAEAVDVRLAAALVEACADGTHLVVVGDPAQAPSAGPGQLLADLIAARTVAVAPLSPGAAEDGPLTRLADAVASGEFTPVSAPEREVVVVSASSAGEAAHRAMQLITDSIPRALNLESREIQIVAALQAGDAGTGALNTACKAALNPGPGALRGFDPGDRVVFTAEGPGYSTGDVGYLRGSTDDGLQVELLDTTVAAAADPAKLLHGWAVTIAAAHGGSWPGVIAVFPPETKGSRPQVYTALTRARQHLSIVHAAGPALAEAVRDVADLHRQTRLVNVLREG